MPNTNYNQNPKEVARAKDYHARALAIFDTGFKTETERKDCMSLLASAYDTLVKEAINYALWSQRTADEGSQHYWVWDSEEAKQLSYLNIPDLHVWNKDKHGKIYAAMPAAVKIANVLRADRDAFKAAALVAKPKTKTAIKQEARAAVAKTCQICGRDIFAERGNIAHHGYQRPGDGYQTASCYGAMHLPFEVSRDRLGAYLALLADQIEALKTARKAVQAEEIALHVSYSSGKYIGRHQEKISVGVTRATFVALRAEHVAKNHRADWSIPATFDDVKDRALRLLASQIKDQSDYLKMQTARYDGWKAVA
jgi:hypothetical protein